MDLWKRRFLLETWKPSFPGSMLIFGGVVGGTLHRTFSEATAICPKNNWHVSPIDLQSADFTTHHIVAVGVFFRLIFWKQWNFRTTKGCVLFVLNAAFEIWPHWCQWQPVTTGGYLIKIHPKSSEIPEGVHWRVNILSKTGAGSPYQDTTAVYSSKSAECEYITMTLSAKMQVQHQQSGPLPVTSKVITPRINDHSYLVGAHFEDTNEKVESCFWLLLGRRSLKPFLFFTPNLGKISYLTFILLEIGWHNTLLVALVWGSLFCTQAYLWIINLDDILSQLSDLLKEHRNPNHPQWCSHRFI